MDLIIENLTELFEEKISSNIKKYVSLNNKTDCYLLLSDYALNDKNKTNNVISYSIISCNIDELQYIVEKIKKYAKKDIKKSRSIHPKFIDLLNRKSIFSINFLLGKVDLFKKDGISPRQSMIDSIELSINSLGKQDTEAKIELKQNLVNFKREISRKSSSLKLIAEITIVSLLTAYIMFLLTKYGNAKEIAWMSDRDKMVEAYSQIAFQLCQKNHHSICVKNNIPTKDVKIYYFMTEEGIFYKELVRIPDYIAGTLADWNKNSPTVSKKKFVTILREVISDNEFLSIFELSFSKIDMRCNQNFITLKKRI